MKSSSADEALVNSSPLVQQSDAYVVNRATKIDTCLESDLVPSTAEDSVSKPGKTNYCDANVMRDEGTQLGGLGKEYMLLREIISSSMKNSLSSLGLRATKGVLLYGPPRTGKTSLAQLCAHDAGVSLFKIHRPEVISQHYGRVSRHFTVSSSQQIFIDELDAIAPARKEGGDELFQRMVATLLNLMDGKSRSEGLLVIAATNRVDCIEPALRRPGR